MRIILSIITVFQFINSYAQNDITTSFNSVHIGKNVNLGVCKNINRHSIGIALKYQINSYVTDNQNEIFKKRFFAKNLSEHIGFNFDYQYNFNLKQSAITPFIFYNLQFTNSHTRNNGYLKYDIDTITNTILYRKYLVFFGPTIALENYLGIGYKVNINKRFFITNKIGGGIVLYYNVDERLYGDGGNWEFGYMINIGVGYRLKEEKNP